MTRRLTAEQLKKLLEFHRSPRAAERRGRDEIRVFRSDEEYIKWRREQREEYLEERKRRQEREDDQQDESDADQ